MSVACRQGGVDREKKAAEERNDPESRATEVCETSSWTREYERGSTLHRTSVGVAQSRPKVLMIVAARPSSPIATCPSGQAISPKGAPPSLPIGGRWFG